MTLDGKSLGWAALGYHAVLDASCDEGEDEEA